MCTNILTFVFAAAELEIEVETSIEMALKLEMLYVRGIEKENKRENDKGTRGKKTYPPYARFRLDLKYPL